MKYIIIFFLASAFYVQALEVRLKDIAKVGGSRDNQITGYGIVTGLAHTGDTKNSVTSESMKNYLKNQGLTTSGNVLTARNIASVMVTAEIPAYAKTGDRIDVTVSSIGDAKSLEGGVLLQSPLKAANGETIAVASGTLSFGGKDTRPVNMSRTGTKTVGIISGGAIVEKDIQSGFLVLAEETDGKGTVKARYLKTSVILENQDYATLDSVNKSILQSFQAEKVQTKLVSPVEIEVFIPEKADSASILGRMENISVVPETKARVVINERTGTVVMGANVKIEEVAISKQGISVIISNVKRQPYHLPSGDEKTENVLVMPEAAKVSDLVKALNKIGATTKDIIAILESLKKSGALHAEVIVQ